MSEVKPDIAFVVPCYNEAENIEDTLQNIHSAASGTSLPYEIIVMDDASTDGTEAAVSRFQAAHPTVAVKFFRNTENRGSGYCHKRGASLSSAQYYSIIPGDNDLPASAITAILAHVGKAEVLVPYPRLEDFRERPFLRRVISKIYTLLVRLLSGHRLRYFHSPAVYPRRFVVEAPQNASGFGYYAELLCEALDRGYSYKEFSVPADYRNEQETSAFRLKNVLSVVASIFHLGRARAVKIMRRSVQLVGKHRLPVLLALCVGGIYFLPNILIPAWQAPAGFGVYHPLSLEAPTLDEVGAYGGRLREVMDGHFADGDAYLAEYKNRGTLWGSNFLAVMLGVVPFLLGMNDPTPIYVFGDFVFPTVTFLVVYALFFTLTRHRVWSALSAIIFLVFPNFSVYRTFLNPSFYADIFVLKIFELLERGFSHFLSRLFVPGFSLMFFTLFLLAVVRLFLKDKPSLKAVVLTAAAFGSLFYVYFYYWVFATVFLSVVFALYFLTRDRARAVAAISVFAGGAILAIPYVVKTLLFRQNQFYAEISQRVGLEISRVFRASSLDLFIFLALLAAVGWFLGKKRGVKQIGVIFAALFLSVVTVVNLQVVTGFNIQSDHWSSRVIVYVTAFILMTTVYWVIDFLLNAFGKSRGRRRLFELLAILAVIFFLTLGLIVQIMSAMMVANDYKIPEDDLIAWRWINNNLPRDAVFVSPSSKATFYIPFFTHGNVYTPPACYSVAPNDEIVDRFLDVSAYFGVPEDFLRRLFLVNVNGSGLPPGTGRNLRPIHFELDPVYMLFCATFIDFKPAADLPPKESLRPFSVDDLADIMNRYEQKLAALNPHRLTLSHKADYVYWGPHERLISSVSPKQYENLRLIFSHNLVEIYEFID